MRVDHIHESDWPAYLADFMSTDEQADYSPELNEFHSLLEAITLAAFDAQRSPEGREWAEWQWRNYKYHSEPRALVRTGRLMNSFVRGDSDNVDEIDGKRSAYGTSVPYAAAHQYGLKSERTEPLHLRGEKFTSMKQGYVNNVARPMLGVSDRIQNRFAETIADGIVERMKG